MFANTVEIDIRDDSPDIRDHERVRQAPHRSRILPQNFGVRHQFSLPAQLVRNATDNEAAQRRQARLGS